MKTFKDILKQDIKQTFMNFDEFGEIHDINGQDVLIIIDENELTERGKRLRRNEGELYKKQLLFYVAAEDFGNLPAPGKILKLDKKQYIITEADNEGGIYAISLEATKS